MQYSRCGRTRVLYKFSITSGVFTTNVLLIKPSILFAFRQASLHWDSTFKSVHIITPKSLSVSHYSSFWFPMEYSDTRFNTLALSPTCITLHFWILNFICHVCAHSCSVFKTSWSFCTSSLLQILLQIVVSSANFKRTLWMFKSKSFINIKNSNGPKTDPCGIPLKTSFQIDTMPFIQTLCVRLSNQFLIQSNSLPPVPVAACVWPTMLVNDFYWTINSLFKCNAETNTYKLYCVQNLH